MFRRLIGVLPFFVILHRRTLSTYAGSLAPKQPAGRWTKTRDTFLPCSFEPCVFISLLHSSGESKFSCMCPQDVWARGCPRTSKEYADANWRKRWVRRSTSFFFFKIEIYFQEIETKYFPKLKKVWKNCVLKYSTEIFFPDGTWFFAKLKVWMDLYLNTLTDLFLPNRNWNVLKTETLEQNVFASQKLK